MDPIFPGSFIPFYNMNDQNQTELYGVIVLDFTIVHLQCSLNQSKDTTSGCDEIHYQMLKHLPLCSKEVLLELYNKLFQTGKFPSQCREAIIILFQKPGKDNT